MKNINKPLVLPNLLFSAFSSIAKTSNHVCPNLVWHEPKMPKCMLDEEKEKAMQ